MASYIQGLTDFVPDIQPFQPDWSTIDRTLRQKQGKYEAGYQNLQNTYSGLLNMPQLKEDQINKRDKFLKQAFDKIGNLASVDLSLQENVATASNVFAPLYNDTEFLGNASVSKHYQQQEAYADGLRQKDGGKEFSMDNLNYVRKQKLDYINDTSPNSWQKYYAGKRYYEPYYDTKKEIREAMEKFKPSSTSIVRLNGLYKEKVDDNSWRESEIKDYLDGVLSDKAKRQLQIEATVRLGDPTTISALYKQNSKTDIGQYTQKINDIDKALQSVKNPQQKDQLITMKNQLASRVQDLQENVSKIDSGDVSFMKGKEEQLAYQMYYNSVIGDVSKGYAHKDVKQDIDKDDVAFGMWQDAQTTKRFMIGESNENYRANLSQDRQDRRTMWGLQADAAKEAKKAKADETPMTITLPSGPNDRSIPTSLVDLDNNVKKLKDEGYNDSQKLKEEISSMTGIALKNLTAKDVKQYMTSPKGKSSQEVAAFIERSNIRHLEIDNAENARRQAEKFALSKMPESFREKNYKLDKVFNDLAKTDTYTLQAEDGSSIQINPKKLSELLSSKKIQIAPKRKSGFFASEDNFNITINGKNYRQSDNKVGTMGGIEKASGQIQQFLNQGNKDIKQYNNYIQQYFGSEQTALNSAFTFGEDSTPIKGTKNKLASLTGLDLAQMGEVSYDIKSSKNKILFMPSPGTKENPIDPAAIKQKLDDKGYTTEILKNGMLSITSNGIDSQLDPFARIPLYGRKVISTLETRTQAPGTKFQSPFYDFTDPKTGSKSSYRIDKRFDGNGGSKYYLIPNGSAVPVESFNSAYEAYQFSQQMALNPELSKKLY